MRTGNLVDDGKYFGLPVLTTTQRDALTPATGWKIFNSTSGVEEVYNGSTWLSYKAGTWTYAINDCDFGNSGSRIIWSTKLIPFLSGTVDTVQIYLTQAGTGATKVSFYDCDNCVIVRSDIYNTYFYGEALDYSGYFGTGVKAVSISGLTAEASLTNNTLYPYSTAAADTIGVSASGVGASIAGSAIGSEGSGGGIGVYLENGGKASISSGRFRLWDTAILASDVGVASTLVTKATVCTENTSYDLKVVHIGTAGSFFGDMDSTKIAVNAPSFGIVFQDSGTGGFTVSDKMNIRFSNTVTTDVSTLITETSAMGLLTGGALTPASGTLGATGLGVWVAPGTGYLVEQTSGFIKNVSWAGTTVPTLYIHLYDASTGGPLLTDNTASPSGTWERSTNGGSSWSAYATTDRANATTYIRYTPASLADNIVIRPVLSLV